MTIFSIIVRATIEYARTKHGDQKCSANRAEISAFFGLNIFMGINQLPSRRLYWDSNPFLGNAGFNKTIPLKRFERLSRYFHISIPEHEEATNKLKRIRPLVSKLEDAFQSVYIPGKNVAIDEGLVKFNGRLSFEQYMPKNPNKFGIKVWMLADSETYFVSRFQVYLGKETDNNAGNDDAVTVISISIISFHRFLSSNICQKTKRMRVRLYAITKINFRLI